jgi:mono/diheme cytochrome c family protein
MPMDMKGKPMTADFIAKDKGVKIQSIFETRCSTCHGSGTKLELDTYEALEKYLK